MKFDLNVNGKPVSVDAPADMPLLWVLRDVLNLAGTKINDAGLVGLQSLTALEDLDLSGTQVTGTA